MKKNGLKIILGILCTVVALLVFGIAIMVFSDTDDSPRIKDATVSSRAHEKKQRTIKAGTPKLTEHVRDKKVNIVGAGDDVVTVFVYMNGCDLESEAHEATTDLMEMMEAGSSKKVNILVQTMGTRRWSKRLKIASDRTQRYKIENGELTLLKDDLGQLASTDEKTLYDFLTWGKAEYPADRYMLVFWDHGGGAVYGFGPDEHQSEDEMLTIDEMQSAIKASDIYFDMIGMDCCIMACLEVTCAFYEYCDYMVLSEDFESSLGWSYKGWLRSLMNNTSIETADLAKIIIDDTVAANEQDYYAGAKTILSAFDESMMKVVFRAWRDFAYANEEVLLNKNYSKKVIATGRCAPVLRKHMRSVYDGFDSLSMDDYYISDIMSVAQSIAPSKSKELSSALNNAIIYSNSTIEDRDLTGLSVTLPYGDREFYDSLKTIYTNCGIDTEYISWLKCFVNTEKSSDYYDFGAWDSIWQGWEYFEDDYDWNDYDWDSYEGDDCIGQQTIGGYYIDDDSYDDDYGDDYYDGYDGYYYDDDDYYDDEYEYEDDYYYDDDDWDDFDDYYY